GVPPLNFSVQDRAGGWTSAEFAKPAYQSGLPGNARLVPDISMLADPQTGAELIETFNGVTEVGVIGGTSLATPLFSAVMAIASQKAGHGLGQAAALVYNLPAGAVTDVVPISAPTNAHGTITTASGTITLAPEQLAGPLGNTTVFYAPLFNSPASTRWDVLTFGTDYSLNNAVGHFSAVLRFGLRTSNPRTPLLDLMDDVRQSLLHRLIWYFAAGLPSLRQERLLLVDVFLVGVLEAGGDNGDLHGVLHVVILHGAENNVGIFVRGFLIDA